MLHLLFPVVLGLASLALAQDCAKPLSGPNMSLKDADIVRSSFPSGSKATFQCNMGFERNEGSSSITCTDGSWSTLTLTCDRVFCGALPGVVSNADVDYSAGSQYTDKITITCTKGYSLFGSKVLTCGADGKWSPHLPSCEPVVCRHPAVSAGVSLTENKEEYKFSETVLYSCPKDLDLIGSRTAECSADKTFKPQPPQCISVSCPDFTIGHGTMTGSRPPHRHLASVTITCLPGFQINGSKHLTCQPDSQWSAKIPTCQLKKPSVTPTVDTGGDGTKPPTTVTPDDASSNVPRALGIAFGVLTVIAVVSVCGCYYGGVPAFIRKKKKSGSRTIASDSEAVKEAEAVPLS